jgi:phosphoribosylformylglycinamidine synthase
MIMAGNCGARIKQGAKDDVIPQLFSEELGLVIEYLPRHEHRIISKLKAVRVPYRTLGETQIQRRLNIQCGADAILDVATADLLSWWEEISDQIESLQMNPDCAREQARHHDRPGPQYHLDFVPLPTSESVMKCESKPKVAILREEGSNGDREMTSAFFAAGFEPWDLTVADLLNGKTSLDGFRGMAFVGGFSYADVLDSAKGWAGIIRFHDRLRTMFDDFYRRPDTFSLGVCNGCQLMALLGWVPWTGIPDAKQPRFIRNFSGRYESRWVTVKIVESPAIMFRGMENSTAGIWIAHGEGRLYCPDPEILREAKAKKLVPCYFVDDEGTATEKYPYNPNGSPQGITSLCSTDGRHLAIMPHPERSFLKWQWPWMPESWKVNLKATPWMHMFQNARHWCEAAKVRSNP